MEYKVAIVGSGLVGRAWAICFLRGGCRVELFDPDVMQAAGAHGLIAEALEDLHRDGGGLPPFIEEHHFLLGTDPPYVGLE